MTEKRTIQGEFDTMLRSLHLDRNSPLFRLVHSVFMGGVTAHCMVMNDHIAESLNYSKGALTTTLEELEEIDRENP
jgi:hypothetical protein